MSDRIVIVTGASGALGSQVVRRWLEAGAKVVAIGGSKSPEGIGESENLAAASFDLTTETGAEAMAEFARASFGEPDTLIHTVGGFSMGPVDGPQAASQWDRMMAMNATSAFHCIRAVLPAMKAKGEGWIVGIASRAAVQPGAQIAAYAASKAALVALIQATADEVRSQDIHVNAILPSTIDTPANRAAMGDAHAAKWVTTDEIAEATLFLCSLQARSIHGATIELYGKS